MIEVRTFFCLADKNFGKVGFEKSDRLIIANETLSIWEKLSMVNEKAMNV